MGRRKKPKPEYHIVQASNIDSTHRDHKLYRRPGPNTPWELILTTNRYVELREFHKKQLDKDRGIDPDADEEEDAHNSNDN